MLACAVEPGCYSLSCQVSTRELADTFDISDPAVTERLRRGTDSLVSNTLLTDEQDY